MKSVPILEVSNLKIEREIKILKGIHWRVDRGQNWVILGANGSGKTCLLSALTGYLPPTVGEISVLGETYGESDWRELRKHIGIVSSSVRQMVEDTERAIDVVVSGREGVINYWGRISPRDRKEALKILRQIECLHLENRPWVYLSQGERQRLLIGRALMAKPPLLILDEPCAGLDPIARSKFLNFLTRMGKKKGSPALIFVTHHVEEIISIFSHVLLLRNGKVLASGPRKKVMTAKNLSEAFHCPVRLLRKVGCYSMVVGNGGNKIL